MMNSRKLSPRFQEHKADFDYCENIIKEHSKSFYAAFSTLPKQKAMSVYAVYAFCRRADDIVDESSDRERLYRLKEDLERFEQGQEKNHPVWRALRVVFDAYEMDIAPFYDMITGQERDLDFSQPQTQAELEDYSYYVAGSVGLMLLPILTDTPATYQDEAIALGVAMQITNILRDVGEDLEKNRIYLPYEVMTQHGYSLDMLKKKTINERFISLWEYEATIAESYYEQSLHLVYNMNEDSKKPLLLSLLFYKEILEAVRLNGYQCFEKRSMVSKRRKLALLKEADERLK